MSEHLLIWSLTIYEWTRSHAPLCTRSRALLCVRSCAPLCTRRSDPLCARSPATLCTNGQIPIKLCISIISVYPFDETLNKNGRLARGHYSQLWNSKNALELWLMLPRCYEIHQPPVKDNIYTLQFRYIKIFHSGVKGQKHYYRKHYYVTRIFAELSPHH